MEPSGWPINTSYPMTLCKYKIVVSVNALCKLTTAGSSLSAYFRHTLLLAWQRQPTLMMK
jgi:hypothetical protein